MPEAGECRRCHVADRLREDRERPVREIRGQREEAQRRDAEYAADDELVHVFDDEEDDVRSGQREAESEQRTGLSPVKAEAEGLRGEPQERHEGSGAAGQPADSQAHRPEA